MQEDTSYDNLGSASSLSALEHFEALGEDAVRHRRGEPAPLLVTTLEWLLWAVAFVVGCFFMQTDPNAPLPMTWSFDTHWTCNPGKKPQASVAPATWTSAHCVPAVQPTAQ